MSWYRLLNSESSNIDLSIEQGDILEDFNVLYFGKEAYLATLSEIETFPEIQYATSNFIILSQSCDLENNKIDSAIICNLISLRYLMEHDNTFRSSDKREDLRRGYMPAYHLLDKCNLNNKGFDYYCVDFKNIFTVPKEYILEWIKTRGLQKRYRLLSPYKEHLSQSFARYFMRVGLPAQIDKNEIKSLKI